MLHKYKKVIVKVRVFSTLKVSINFITPFCGLRTNEVLKFPFTISETNDSFMCIFTVSLIV